MANKDGLTKALAIAGTALVWLPILAPVFFSAASLLLDGVFRFDYMMPAELGPVALAGAGLLLWAALRARSQVKLIGGGDAADLKQVRPYLDLLGQRVLHVGGHGMGTSLKVVFNSLLAGAMAVFSEGMALGQSLGLSQHVLLDLLLNGPVVPPIITGKRARFEANDFADADFPLQWMRKDLQLATQTAYE